MKKLLCALLLMLLIGVLPVCAEGIEELTIEIPMQVNPLYADVLDPAQMQVEPSGGFAMFADPVYGTVEEAIIAARENMKVRNDRFTVYVQVEIQEGVDPSTQILDLYDTIFRSAMEHTGQPGEGDNLRWQYAYRDGASFGYSYDDKYYYLPFPYIVGYYTTLEQEEELDAAVEALLSELSLDGKSCYQKVSDIYAYMTANITYDHAGLEDDTDMLEYTAYDALINKSAVCQGYANLFYRLALEAGVDNRLISGIADNGETVGGHAWNIVKLGNSYYNLDATWDAEWVHAGYDYNYYLRSPANFTDHVRDAEYTTDAFHAVYPMAEEDFPVAGIVDSGTCGESVCWWLTEDGTLTISGTGEMDYYYEDERPWFVYKDTILSVKIESGVTNIASYAFENCGVMTNVTIPDTVRAIGSSAFMHCSSLADITIPDSVTSIGSCAFFYCKSIKTVDIPYSITKISYATFSGCSSLSSVRLPDGLVHIAGEAFARCVSLENIVFPDGVMWLESCSFNGCSKLTDIVLPDSVTRIEAGVFSGCGLNKIVIPPNVAYIGLEAFSRCEYLKEITFEGSARAIEMDGMSGDGLFYEVAAIVYYPANDSTWTQEVMQDYGGTITWVPYTKTLADVEQWSLSLGDDIGANFYVAVEDNAVAEAVLRMTVDGKVTEYKVADIAPGSDGLRVFTAEVAAAQMTQIITVELVVGEEVTVLGEYTVLEYAQYILNDTENQFTDIQKNLVKAMLVYGGAAQAYFSYELSSPADTGISFIPAAMPDAVPTVNVVGDLAGIRYHGATLLFESKTVLRYYFTASGSIEDYTFAIGETTCEPVLKNGLYYVEMTGINPQNLDETVDVVVSNGNESFTVTYSPMHYMVRKYHNGTDSLKNLLQAMYGYYLAAEAYTA